MRLHSITIQGIGRFEEPQTLQMLSKLTAVVGENEAGKTSLLRAIQIFDGSAEIPASAQTSLSPVDPLITGTFALSQADCKEVGVQFPTLLKLVKKKDGGRVYTFTPPPSRDTELREDFAKRIKTKKFRAAILANYDRIFEEHPDHVISSLSRALGESDRPIDEDELSNLERYSELIDEIDSESDLYGYWEILRDLVKFEKNHNPSSEAWSRVKPLIPKIVNFTSDYRRVNIPYNVLNFGNDDAEQPSKALSELISISELDMSSLKGVLQSGDAAAREGIVSAANAKLSDRFKEKWSQSDATLHFQVSDNSLNVIVKNTEKFDDKYKFSNFDQRSDGYRQFIALQLFILSHDLSGSILLLDEIEHHLHYDAQADLVQMLQREERVSQVIYSTHSIGSLPEDLGLGVRSVKWDSDHPKRSVIINKFWEEEGDSGFRPLLFGMGATTLAFFPTRKALIGEGPTELLLLPKMFKQAMGLETLDFQIVHGLANLSPIGLSIVDKAGGGVCYLVDNDASGGKIRNGLETAGVKVSHIFGVADLWEEAITTEDLLDAGVWQEAVNEIGGFAGIKEKVIPSRSGVPKTDRIKALPSKIRQSKIALCYSIVRQLEANPGLRIISADAKPGLSRVGNRLRKLLHKGG